MATPTVAESGAVEDFFQLLYRGGELLAEGNAGEAKDYLEKALGLQPDNEKGKNLLGLTYFKLGLFDRAAHLYEGLVQENPADPTLRVNLGLVYLKTNALSRAIHEFATATDLAPDHHKAHNYLGLALAQAGQYEKAREHFLLAGSQAMADKMAQAVTTEPVMPSDGQPLEAPALEGAVGFDGAPASSSEPAAPFPADLLSEAAGVDATGIEADAIREPTPDEAASWEKTFDEAEGPTQPQFEKGGAPPAAVTVFPAPSPPATSQPAEAPVPERGGEPALTRAALKLGELVRAVGIARQAPSEPFEIRSDVVLISVGGEMLTRLSGLIAYAGAVEFKPERKRFRGRLTDRGFGEGPEQVMRAKGSGTLILEPKKRNFLAIDVGGESAYFREDVVYAFEGALAFENGRLPSEMTPDLDLAYLRGNGQVLLCCGGPVRSLEVSPARSVAVPLDDLVGWYGNLTPRISILAFDENGKVIRAGVELSGTGFVLFSSPLS